MQRKWYIVFLILVIGLSAGVVRWRTTAVPQGAVRSPLPSYPNAQHISVANVDDVWNNFCSTDVRTISRVTRFQTTDSLSAVRKFYRNALFSEGIYHLAEGYSFLEGTKYSDVFIHETEVTEEDIFKASIGFGVWVQADAVKDQTLVTISELTYKQVHATCDPM